MSLQLNQNGTFSPPMGGGGPRVGGSEVARRRLLSTRAEPLFLADWLDAVFLHYEVPPDELQRGIPFELDLRDGRAYVSLVAFTMSRMRPRWGGRLSAWLLKPISSNRFLNVRTYVRYRGEQGIYFIREWLDNRLSVLLGPRTFRLPYRFGELDYRHAGGELPMCGVVRETPGGPGLAYQASRPADAAFQTCASGSLDDFLIERYIAFTSYGGRHRFFRVWHPPWQSARVEAEVTDERLLRQSWRWFSNARRVVAHYSRGVRDVWMGRPRSVRRPAARVGSHRHSSFFELP